MTILVDHNLKGHALLLWGTLAAEGWFALLPLRLLTFEDVGLPVNSSDRAVWRFVQTNRMLLLTGNRSMKGPHSVSGNLKLLSNEQGEYVGSPLSVFFQKIQLL